MTAWRPIETAPDDGRFLVRGGTWIGDWSGEHPATVTMVDGRDGDRGFFVADTEYYGPVIAGATHWMPAPT